MCPRDGEKAAVPGGMEGGAAGHADRGPAAAVGGKEAPKHTPPGPSEWTLLGNRVFVAIIWVRISS